MFETFRKLGRGYSKPEKMAFYGVACPAEYASRLVGGVAVVSAWPDLIETPFANRAAITLRLFERLEHISIKSSSPHALADKLFLPFFRIGADCLVNSLRGGLGLFCLRIGSSPRNPGRIGIANPSLFLHVRALIVSASVGALTVNIFESPSTHRLGVVSANFSQFLRSAFRCPLPTQDNPPMQMSFA